MPHHLSRLSTITGSALAGLISLSATAAPIVIEDFADALGNPSFGTFGNTPGGSGSSGGLVKASTSSTTAISTTQWEFTPAGQTSFFNNLSILDDPALSGGTNFGVPVAWTIRHTSNNGGVTPANTVSTAGGVGHVGFYMRTTAANITAAIALDEVGGSGGTEASSRVSIINDGQWHLYQFSLADATQWDALFGGNGTLDGTSYSIDSIFLYNTGPNNGERSDLSLAYVTYDSAGPLVSLVPEPTSLCLLLSGGAIMLMRRRAA